MSIWIIGQVRGLEDVVRTDDAFAAEELMDSEGERLYGIANGIWDTSGRYLIGQAVVFAVVIEELAMVDYLRNGESHLFLAGAIHATRDLRAAHECFDNNLIAFGKSSFDSGLNLLGRLHFGAAETAATYIALDEAR